MSQHPKNILILGGSYGGISIAHHILKHTLPKLPNNQPHQIILVSTSSHALCRPATPRALISDDLLPQDKLFVDIRKQFEQYPPATFQFIQGTAVELDHNARTVSVKVRNDDSSGGVEKIDYHALVIATGASTPSPLLGLNGDEAYLRSNWASFRTALPQAKSILIVGGGPAGIETAGELGEHLNGRAGWFSSRLENPKVQITVVTAGSEILPGLRVGIARKAEVMLAQVGVSIVKNARVKDTFPPKAGRDVESVGSKVTVTLEDGRTIDADLYVPATGMIPNSSFLDKELLTDQGRVQTDSESLRVTKAGERVYAIGDVASYARPAVHLILDAVPVLAANLRKDLLLAVGQEGGEERNFEEDIRETQMVPIGMGRGVGAAMGYQLPSILVWLIKGRDYWLWTVGGLWSGKQWEKAS